MKIVTGFLVPSDTEKDRRLLVHQYQLHKILNRQESFLHSVAGPTVSQCPSIEIRRKLTCDIIGEKNKLLSNRINKITKAAPKPIINYEYLTLKKLSTSLDGKSIFLSDFL